MRSRSIAVRALTPPKERGWDRYVGAHPRATFFHQLGWKRVLQQAFGYKPLYLLAECGGGICGVLPLFACRSIMGGLSLYSLPHTVYGGVAGDDAEVEQALLESARDLGRSLGARSIELRNRHPSLLDLAVQEGCVTFERELPESADQVRGTYPKKAREAINQATKRHKLECDFGGDLDTFYDLLAASYLSLGTPVFPKNLFANLLREFPEQAIVQVIRHQGVPVATVLSVAFRDTMMPLYSGEASGTKNLKAGNFKYFRLMQEAVERGLRRFDFGRTRSDNGGVVQFKINQGFVPEVLPYQSVALAPGAGGMTNPNSGVYPRLRGIWRRLPARLARTVGPRVVRFFP